MPNLLSRDTDTAKEGTHTSGCECGAWFKLAQVVNGTVTCKECGYEKAV